MSLVNVAIRMLRTFSIISFGLFININVSFQFFNYIMNILESISLFTSNTSPITVSLFKTHIHNLKLTNHLQEKCP